MTGPPGYRAPGRVTREDIQIATAAAREWTPRSPNRRSRWVRTVRREISSLAAISLSSQPIAISSTICASRLENE